MKQLSEELETHPDRQFRTICYRVFILGFDTGLNKLLELPFVCNNLLSAKIQPEITT